MIEFILWSFAILAYLFIGVCTEIVVGVSRKTDKKLDDICMNPPVAVTLLSWPLIAVILLWRFTVTLLDDVSSLVTDFLKKDKK